MTMGDLSTLLVWGAATAFTIALIGYSVALARIADASSRSDRGAAPVERAVPAGVGVGGAGSSGVSVDEAEVGGGAVGGPDGGSGAGTGTVSGIDDGVSARSKATGIARTTGLLGLVFLFLGIVLRGVASGRWPTANMYEFTLVGAFVATLVLVLVQRRRLIPFLGVVVMGIAVLALVLGLNVFYIRADAVQPALRSYWLVIHVGVAITATGVFTVAFATAVLQVLQESREVGRSHLEAPWPRWVDGARRGLHRWRITGPAWSWLRTVPTARELEALSFRLNAIAFVLWTLTLIGGALWAEQAWGRYWGWDPKEVGTFVAWVVYAAYLHARTTRGWSGRRAAYFVFVGYAVVLANFTVVNLFVTGKHSYSGL
ncbi:c-type cytochrome biogenesis protein CcsB [Cellulomonas hominis]